MDNEKMHWDRLINDKRFGLEHYHDPKRGGTRSDFLRDYDRLVFSSPFRRLQNKTQVFPLPGSIFVHNRLTHSLEVSCVGRSMATGISRVLHDRYSGKSWVSKLDAMGEIVGAACLAHDLGNPPFGHSGEKAISTFFSEGPGRTLKPELTPEQWADLIHFDGNANALRLLTHRFEGRRPGGFAMTYSTLASIVKYPYEASLAGNSSKFGFFSSEKETMIKVASELGMISQPGPQGELRYARHPLVYIVEAADDICYEVMDIEDAHKLGILDTSTVIELMMAFFEPERRDHMLHVMANVTDPNEQVGYLRSSVIGRLVECCCSIFIDHEEPILSGNLQNPLVNLLPPREYEAFKQAERLSWDRIYCAPDVVDIELAGNRIISFLMEKLIDAVRSPTLNYSRLLLAKVPKQYQIYTPTLFGKIQAAIDHISGMTDVYALDLYRKLNAMSLKINN